MARFRKKPVVIEEAVQWFYFGDHPAVKGENYPFKPDIFEMTYERVEE